MQAEMVQEQAWEQASEPEQLAEQKQHRGVRLAAALAHPAPVAEWHRDANRTDSQAAGSMPHPAGSPPEV